MTQRQKPESPDKSTFCIHHGTHHCTSCASTAEPVREAYKSNPSTESKGSLDLDDLEAEMRRGVAEHRTYERLTRRDLEQLLAIARAVKTLGVERNVDDTSNEALCRYDAAIDEVWRLADALATGGEM